MTLSEINEKLTRLTGENTTRYTNAQRAVDLTISLDKVATSILDSQDDADYDDPNHTGFPVLSTPLVASQRDYSFAISDNVLQYKEVEVSWDGTTFYKATRLDRSINPYPLGNDALIDTYFTREAPQYDIEGLSIILYPKPTTSTGSVVVRVSRDVTPVTEAQIVAGTKVLGIDRAFHMLVLLLTVQQRYTESNIVGNKLQRVLTDIQDYELRLRRQYSRKQIDGNMHFMGAQGLDNFN